MRIPTESTGVKVRKEACRSNARRSYLSGRCAHNSKRMLSRAATPPTELGSSGFTVVSAAPATAPLVRPRAAPEAAPPAAPAFARARRSEGMPLVRAGAESQARPLPPEPPKAAPLPAPATAPVTAPTSAPAMMSWRHQKKDVDMLIALSCSLKCRGLQNSSTTTGVRSSRCLSAKPA